MLTTEKYFTVQDIYTLHDNLFRIIGNDWMLITAGDPEKFNMMTASWGTMGILWNKPIAISFIRPSRYTYKFMEESSYYTLTFFGKEHKKILQFCGSASGKHVDKIRETGLIPLKTKYDSIIYKQCRLAFECKKIYFDDLKYDNFIYPGTADINYPSKEYHRIYIGEIINCYAGI